MTRGKVVGGRCRWCVDPHAGPLSSHSALLGTSLSLGWFAAACGSGECCFQDPPYPDADSGLKGKVGCFLLGSSGSGRLSRGIAGAQKFEASLATIVRLISVF